MKGQVATWEIVISITIFVIVAAFVTIYANSGSQYAMQNLKLSKGLYDGVNLVVNDDTLRGAVVGYFEGEDPQAIIQRLEWVNDEFGINLALDIRGTGFYGGTPKGDSLAFDLILPVYQNTKYEKVEVRVYA